MGIPKEMADQRFTYKDYKLWPEGERWELIHGEAYSMSPAPNRRHQKFLGNIAYYFLEYFLEKTCEVYLAPFDVLLSEMDEEEDLVDTVVQPDLCVICDPAKLTDQGCKGAPDFVLEILSPATAFKDMDEKLKLYEQHGVNEYWIVNPANDTVLAYRRSQAGGFDKPLLFTKGEILQPDAFPGLNVDLTRIFRK